MLACNNPHKDISIDDIAMGSLPAAYMGTSGGWSTVNARLQISPIPHGTEAAPPPRLGYCSASYLRPGCLICAVLEGRMMYVRGFLHSYVQCPGLRHFWQTADAVAAFVSLQIRTADQRPPIREILEK